MAKRTRRNAVCRQDQPRSVTYIPSPTGVLTTGVTLGWDGAATTASNKTILDEPYIESGDFSMYLFTCDVQHEKKYEKNSTILIIKHFFF